MDAVEPREGSDRVPDSLAASGPAPAADEVKTEAADATAAEPAAACGASEAKVTEAVAEGPAAEQERAVGSSVMDADESGVTGEEHSVPPEASKVTDGSISGEMVVDLPPVASETKMEVDEGDVANQERSAAVAVTEVNAQIIPGEVQRVDPVVSELKMEVDDARISEEEHTAAPVGSKIKMEEGDGRVPNQEAATPAGALMVKQESGECLVGRYIGKTASWHGRILIGKVASYDCSTDVYSVVFEDGHGEGLGLSQLQQLLMAEENGVSGMKVSCRKRKLDLLVSSGGGSEVKAPPSTRQRVDSGDMPTRPDVSQQSGSGSDMSQDNDISSDSSDVTKEAPSDSCPPVQAVELPPSSGDIAVPEESISYLFSVYNFLRSFSVQLFLSPFGLDDFVAAINCTVQNNLLDAVHVSLLRAMRRHLEAKSAEGSQLASNCLKYLSISLS
jgi:hypothetical protein